MTRLNCVKRKGSRRAREAGFTFAEKAIAAVFLIVFATIVFNIAILIISTSINDSACRSATQAARQGSDYTIATSLANAAVKAHRTDGYFISQPAITFLDYHTFDGNPPPGETPYVQIRTEVTVKLPVPLLVFGVKLNDDQTMIFKQMYAYPIILKRRA